jgi:hypothetical protein
LKKMKMKNNEKKLLVLNNNDIKCLETSIC